MITKEELYEIPRMFDRINEKKARRERLQEKATSPPGTNNDERVQTSKKSDKMTDLAVLVCDLDNEIEEDEKELAELRRKAETLFSRVDGINREILVLRYAEGETWDEIGDALNYSERHVRRIHLNIINTVYG